LFKHGFLAQFQAFIDYGNLRIWAIFDHGAGDYNLVQVLEQKGAKNSRFSASIFRSRAKIARGTYLYRVK
jgi:hypothetical protein